MSYGVEPVELFRRAAAYVDRILKGASQPSFGTSADEEFELVDKPKSCEGYRHRSPCPRSCSRRPYGRSQCMRSKPLNFTELVFYLRNSHPLDFLTLFGKDFASLAMLRGGTSR